MHNQIFGFTNNLKLSFNKVINHFTIDYFRKNCYFIMDKLEHLARVGENISLPFVKAITNINWFYVEEIQHEFQATTQNIHITLKVGSHNSFWHFRKGQAVELDEVGFRDSLDLSDSQLKKKVYFNNHWHRY